MIPLYDENPVKNRSYVRVIILIICLIVFLYQQGSNENQFLIYYFGFKPASLLGEINYPTFTPMLTLFTSMFMHSGWMHFLGNMLYLWIFADNVEDKMGKKKFIFFYISCGLVAAISQAIINIESQIPMIGASGAIAGVLGSYMYFFPKAKILVLVPFLIFFTIKVPAYILLLIWFLLQFYNFAINNIDSSVAWLAHIAGFATGYLYCKIYYKNVEVLKGKTKLLPKNKGPWS
tara:strand:- start:1302 stop:2000 length:699 start_codon:yes stop_codon:yes gene_type:complete